MSDKIPVHRGLIYSLIIVFFFFGGVELIFRLYDFKFYFNFSADILSMPLLDMCKLRRIANRTVEFDFELFWKYKPNQVISAPEIFKEPIRINNFGFRGKDFQIEKPKGVYRIICLGDSVTAGFGVSDQGAYPAQLEAMLKRIYPDCQMEVINLGVTGYSSFQGRNLFLKLGEKLKPDLVIIGFGPNDRLPALNSDQEHYQIGTWRKNSLDLFLSRLQLYKLVKAGVIYLKRRSQGLSLNPKTYVPRLKRKVSESEYQENLTAIKNRCEELGCEMVILNVDFPSLSKDPSTDALKELAKKSNGHLPEDWQEWDSLRLNHLLGQNLRVLVLDFRSLFLDYLKELQAGAGDRARKEELDRGLKGLLDKEPWRYLMVDNGHPNEWGHKILVQELAKMIEQIDGFQSFIERCQKKN